MGKRDHTSRSPKITKRKGIKKGPGKRLVFTFQKENKLSKVLDKQEQRCYNKREDNERTPATK